MLNVSYLQELVLVFPAWVAAVSIIILKASWPRLPAGVATTPERA